LTSCKPVNFSRRTLHHGVSKCYISLYVSTSCTFTDFTCRGRLTSSNLTSFLPPASLYASLTLLAGISFSDNQSPPTPYPIETACLSVPGILLGLLVLEDGADSLSRNVGKKTITLRCVKSQTFSSLIRGRGGRRDGGREGSTKEGSDGY